MSVSASPPRPRFSRRTLAIFRWIAIALVIHLVPLFLPRKMPERELALARMLPAAEYRIRFLEPLLENPRSTPGDLRDAADLVLAASVPLARQFLREAERRGADPVDAELLRARICRAEHDLGCANSAMERAKKAAPGDPRPDLAEARFLENDGDPAGALIALQRAHQKVPGDVALTLALARALGAARRETEASALIDGLEGTLSAAERWIEQGKLGLAAGDPARARSAFLQAVALEPSRGEGSYLLGVSLFQLGEFDEAERTLREAAKLDRRDFRPLALLCALYREQLRRAEASTVRLELIRWFPDREPEYTSACPP